MLYIALFLGKLAYLFSRLFNKGGGSALPGLIALKIYPNLIQKLISQIPTNILVTGTNGKTTTSSLIAHFVTNSGHTIIHNTTGSNLARGVASHLISGSSLFGNMGKIDLGIWEVDEAVFPQLLIQIRPAHVVVLNLSRDQLDRYGETDSIIKKWKSALEKASWKPHVYINADDGAVYSLHSLKNLDVETFGVLDSTVIWEKKSTNPHFDIQAKIIEQRDISSITIVFSNNVYNFLVAYLVAQNSGTSRESIESSIASFSSVFGRMERLLLGKKELIINLIKNPVGATQVIHSLSKFIKKEDTVLLILNDKLADGTDVSWIWDTDFEKLQSFKGTFIAVGTRKSDMALRLFYAGIAKEKITVVDEISRSITSFLDRDDKGRLFILPTYTALLELQTYLKDNDYKQKHWHES